VGLNMIDRNQWQIVLQREAPREGDADQQ
jgi:hypothetical protein